VEKEKKAGRIDAFKVGNFFSTVAEKGGPEGGELGHKRKVGRRMEGLS